MAITIKRIRLLLAAGLATLAFGCGNDTGKDQAQPGSLVTISPATVDWDADVLFGPATQLQHYVINFAGPGGGPQRNTQVQVFLDLSTGTTTIPILALFDAGGTAQTSPFVTSTDDFGNIAVAVQFPVGAGTAFKATLQAFSGGSFGNSTLTVTCSDANALDAITC